MLFDERLMHKSPDQVDGNLTSGRFVHMLKH